MGASVRTAVIIALGLAGLPAAAVAADGTSVFVVPGRPGVPVMHFGRDLSWAVVESDHGLDRPGSDITVIPYGPSIVWGPAAGGYFPSTGQAPRSGRLEVEPPANRKLPPPAESYHREYGAESAHTPVTMSPPAGTPPVVLAPQIASPPVHQNPRPLRRAP